MADSVRPKNTPYFVYLLECADGTFYCGSTTDLERRLDEHNTSLKGASYTRGRRPVTLRYSEICASRSDAQKREAQLKKLTRKEKEKLLIRF